MQATVPNRQPLLELQKVSFRYPSMSKDASSVIDNLDFQLASGEVLHVTGRNGSGKTTLLKLITKELTPTRGNRVEKKPELRAVYLNQHTGDFLGESLTVREQLAMGLPGSLPPLHAVRPRFVDAKIKTLLQTYGVGLETKLDSFTSELSGGQRQIVALLAVLQEPGDILALDEFSAHMDVKSAALSTELLNKIAADQQRALVVAGHDCEHLKATRVVEL